MRMALKTLVLLFVVALALTVLGQPASAHYDPWAKQRAAIAGQYEAKVRELAAQNARLKEQLEASREQTQAARKQVDELKLRLQCARNAIVLRDKRHDRLSQKKEAVCTESVDSKTSVECTTVMDVPTTLALKPANAPGASNTAACFRVFDRVRSAVGELLFGLCRPPWISAAVKNESGEASRETAEPVVEKVLPGLESLRRRIKDLGTRLKSAVEKRPVPQKVMSEKPSPAPQAPLGLREKLLEGLREAFRSELQKRLDALRRQLEGRTETEKRRSTWF
jgi:outer membrane murein-binding lipoprotein Lpp